MGQYSSLSKETVCDWAVRFTEEYTNKNPHWNEGQLRDEWDKSVAVFFEIARKRGLEEQTKGIRVEIMRAVFQSRDQETRMVEDLRCAGMSTFSTNRKMLHHAHMVALQALSSELKNIPRALVEKWMKSWSEILYLNGEDLSLQRCSEWFQKFLSTIKTLKEIPATEDERWSSCALDYELMLLSKIRELSIGNFATAVSSEQERERLKKWIHLQMMMLSYQPDLAPQVAETEKFLVGEMNAEIGTIASLAKELHACPSLYKLLRHETIFLVENLMPFLRQHWTVAESVTNDLSEFPKTALEILKGALPLSNNSRKNYCDAFEFVIAMKKCPDGYTDEDLVCFLRFLYQAKATLPDAIGTIMHLPPEARREILNGGNPLLVDESSRVDRKKILRTAALFVENKMPELSMSVFYSEKKWERIIQSFFAYLRQFGYEEEGEINRVEIMHLFSQLQDRHKAFIRAFQSDEGLSQVRVEMDGETRRMNMDLSSAVACLLDSVEKNTPSEANGNESLQMAIGEWKKTIDAHTRSEQEIVSWFRQFLETFSIIMSVEDESRNLFLQLIITCESKVRKIVQSTRLSAEEIGKSRDKVRTFLEKQLSVFQEKHGEAQRQIEGLSAVFEALSKKLYRDADTRIHELEEIHDDVQRFSMLSDLFRTEKSSRAREQVTFLKNHWHTVESVANALKLSPKIVKSMVQKAVQASPVQANRLDCFGEMADCIQCLQALTQEPYTDDEISFLLSLVHDSLSIHPDVRTVVSRFSSETIRDLLSNKNLLDISELRQSCFLFLYYGETVASFARVIGSRWERLAFIDSDIVLTQEIVRFLSMLKPDQLDACRRWFPFIGSRPQLFDYVRNHYAAFPILDRFCLWFSGEQDEKSCAEWLPKVQRAVDWIERGDHAVVMMPPEVLELDPFLTSDVRMKLFQTLPPSLWPPQMWYDVEFDLEHNGLKDRWITMGEYLSHVDVSRIPVEILIRFLSERPTDEAIRWLKESACIGGDTEQKRIDMLTAEQKVTLLRRFRQIEGQQPLEKWREALGVDVEAAKEISAYAERPIDVSCLKMNDDIRLLANPADPLSLFGMYASRQYSVESMVMKLLVGAREESICGGRRFLVWGDSGRSNDFILCARDGIPLRLRDSKQRLRSYFEIGLFNTPSCNVSAYTLHEMLLSLKDKDRHGYRLLENIVEGRTVSLNPSPRILELTNELRRIAVELRSIYPKLDQMLAQGEIAEDLSSGDTSSRSGDESDASSSTSDETDCSSSTDSDEERAVGEAAASAPGGSVVVAEESDDLEVDMQPGVGLPLEPVPPPKYFQGDRNDLSLTNVPGYSSVASWFGLLQKAGQHFSKRLEGYQENNHSHVHAVFIQSVLLALRNATVQDLGSGSVKVTISPFVEWNISVVPDDQWTKPVLKDQQEMDLEQLSDVISQYCPHTITAVTPARMRLDLFMKTAQWVKSLSDDEFLRIFDSCKALMEMEQDVDFIDAWWNQCLSGVEKDPALETFFLQMRDRFYVLKSKRPVPLEPKKSYVFRRTEIGQFVPSDMVPSFLRSEGNFSSAICQSFMPYEPERHDGNCGVNSFLLGVNGLDVYSTDKERLNYDIHKFRANIVAYATDHRALLVEKFGLELVDDVISKFAAGDFDSWANTVVWTCAAQIYHRPVHVYSMMEGIVFSTDENAKVLPAGSFEPEGEHQMPSVHLMLWDDAHYCLLVPKSS